MLLKLSYALHRAGHWQEGRALVKSTFGQVQLGAHHPSGTQAIAALAEMAYIKGEYAKSKRCAMLLTSSPQAED